MRTLVLTIALCFLTASCSKQHTRPSAKDLQPLLGKTVREVFAALNVPESALRAGAEPPSRFRFVSGYLPGEPLGHRLTVYVSREAALISADGKVSAAELFDKRATGIALSFPVAEKRADVAVGEIISY
jgi:hypothetical protein